MAHQTTRHWLTLIQLLIKRELKIRYRSSFFGYLWSMLNPLLTMLVLTAVFSYAMRVQLPNYPIYLLSGILCWNVFNQSVMNGVGGIVGNAPLLKKVRVPSWVFPTATIGSAYVHMILALAPFAIISIAMGVYPNWSTLQFPLVLILFFIFIEGVVLLLSSLNVFFRDIGHVLEPILQLGFYASPILYPLEVVPPHFQIFIKMNPMYYFLEGFRFSIYDPQTIPVLTWALMTVVSVVSIGLGVIVYKKCEHRFLYHI